MKKFLLRALALALAVCMTVPILSVMVSAAGSTTYIVVSIEDDEGTTAEQPYLIKLTGESSHYLTEEAPLLAEVVAIINAFYPHPRPAVWPSDTLWDFRSPAMQAVMDEGLAAYRTGNDQTWADYVDKYFEDVQPVAGDPELKAILKDKTSTLGDVTPNVAHKISYYNDVVGDAKYGVTYTVTVTRYVEGGGAVVPPADKPELNREDHVAYIIGYEDGTVRPGNDITRAEVATIFFRLLTEASRSEYWCKENEYSDVDADKWYNNAISTLANAGIVTGYPDGTFHPNAPISRAEFATIAARFSEVVYNGGNSFTDVPENHWAARYIALAEYLGWVNGYPDGSFKPDQNISRAEAMTLINRVLERAVEEEGMLEGMVTWTDNLPGIWYYEAVQEATNSHTYVRTDKVVSEQDYCYEDWQAILPVPDWAALEKSWSDSNL